MGEALPLRSARVCRSGEGFQNGVIKKVRERSVTHVMEESRNAERFDNEPFAWRRFAVVGEPRRE